MESPFYACSRYDYCEIVEYLLRRYGRIEPFLEFNLDEFVKIWNISHEEYSKERNYILWANLYPNMTKDNFISFEDFHAKVTGKNIDKRSNEEILGEVEEIRRKMKNG